MYYTYILYSGKLDKYYVGYTSSIVDRLEYHLSNHKWYTAKAKDWQIVFSKEFKMKDEAYLFERKI